jgi:cell division protein FtsB
MGAMGRKKIHKSFIIRLCILAFVIYAAVMIVDMQVTLTEQQRHLDELAETYNTQFLENKELERRLVSQKNEGMDKEYIERVARDEFNYVYPNERVFKEN